MNHFIDIIFGHGKDLTALQICVRSVIMFFITLILIRLGGLRIFGKKSAFDMIVSITLGAILSRGVVGATPFFSVVLSGLMLVLVHRLVSWLCIRSRSFAHLVTGRPVILYDNGEMFEKRMTLHSLSRQDLEESLRISTGKKDLEDIKQAILEPNGKISFIKK